METTTAAKDASRGRFSGSRLFRSVVRLAFVAITVAAVWYAQDRRLTFQQQQLSGNFEWNTQLWVTYGIALVLGGFAFGLALWLPFSRLRDMPSRIAFAAMALLRFLRRPSRRRRVDRSGRRCDRIWVSSKGLRSSRLERTRNGRPAGRQSLKSGCVFSRIQSSAAQCMRPHSNMPCPVN